MIYGTVKKKQKKEEIRPDRGEASKYTKYKKQDVQQCFNMSCYV